jgi:2'-5' RNA ligase
MRTFIAIELEDDLKERLTALIKEFMSVSQNIRWVKKQAMHLTLKFLGEIDQDKISQIESLLTDIAHKADAFPLQLKGTGAFPPGKRKPRVLWVGITENPSLLRLQEEIESGCERMGFPKEKRRFHPHLTLGRVKDISKLGGVLPLLEEKREIFFGEMTVKKITFFQSVLKPTGAEYNVLAEFRLR